MNIRQKQSRPVPLVLVGADYFAKSRVAEPEREQMPRSLPPLSLSEMLEYIESHLVELNQFATTRDCKVLANLLMMARIEASNRRAEMLDD